jgi:hypothetical protein
MTACPPDDACWRADALALHASAARTPLAALPGALVEHEKRRPVGGVLHVSAAAGRDLSDVPK